MSGQKIIKGLEQALSHARGEPGNARVYTVETNNPDADLVLAIAEFRAKLPGWWFTVGECSVSCDATVGPDVAYASDDMLRLFDEGFDGDLRQPSTMADALRRATALAMEALKAANGAV